MSVLEDPFKALLVEEESTEFETLSDRPIAAPPESVAQVLSAATARLHGFDLEERPLVVGLPGLPHEIVAAQTTVPLLTRHIGRTLVILFEQGDARRPIVVGVIQDAQAGASSHALAAPHISAQIDDQRIVLTAEREIVLRCGEASVTLTRAGKVVIKGTYVLSRSSGYNKIKGAAVDIN
jgi:hypothetical protein